MAGRNSRFWNEQAIALIDREDLSKIVTTASDLSIAISAGGVVLSVMVNEGETGFGNLHHWEGCSLRDFLTDESIEKFDAVLADVAQGAALTRRWVELNHRDGDEWEFPIRYIFHSLGQDGAMLMLGRDLRLIAETQQQLVQTQLALERGYQVRREFDARYRLLFNAIKDGAVFVAVSDGRIKDVNTMAAQLIGARIENLEGSIFANLFDNRHKADFTEALLKAASGGNDEAVEVVLKKSGNRLRISPQVFRVSGERLLFCLLEPSDQDTASLDSKDVMLKRFLQNCPDAFVITDEKGEICYVNDAFLDLTGHADVKDLLGRSFGDILVRGQVDLRLLIDSLNKNGTLPHYAARLRDMHQRDVAVDLSGSLIAGAGGRQYGFVLRDRAHADAVLHRKPHDDAERHAEIAELVGSISLKEILAESTEVIERICIKTAVALTGNNRVEAAEMLGLSRQSLYVKLRKYGLLSRETDE